MARVGGVYSDYDSCAVCGAEVRLEPHPGATATETPAGPRDGVVGAGDAPVDRRVCTNGECPSHAADGPDA